MIIESPSNNRLAFINSCLAGTADPNELTEVEYIWMQNYMMDTIVRKMSETNALTFFEVENGLLN